MSFIKEFWEFAKVRKKYWLLIILLSIILIGGFVILAIVLTLILAFITFTNRAI